MKSQVVTVEELVQYHAEIVEAYGDIPAVTVSRVDGLVEEGDLYAEAPQTEVALIH